MKVLPNHPERISSQYVLTQQGTHVYPAFTEIQHVFDNFKVLY